MATIDGLTAQGNDLPPSPNRDAMLGILDAINPST